MRGSHRQGQGKPRTTNRYYRKKSGAKRQQRLNWQPRSNDANTRPIKLPTYQPRKSTPGRTDNGCTGNTLTKHGTRNSGSRSGGHTSRNRRRQVPCHMPDMRGCRHQIPKFHYTSHKANDCYSLARPLEARSTKNRQRDIFTSFPETATDRVAAIYRDALGKPNVNGTYNVNGKVGSLEDLKEYIWNLASKVRPGIEQ